MKVVLLRIANFSEFFITGPFVLAYGLQKASKGPLLIPETFMSQFLWLIPVMIFFQLVNKILSQESFEDFFREDVFSLIVFVPLLITYGDREFLFWLSSVHLFSTMVNTLFTKKKLPLKVLDSEARSLNLGMLYKYKLSPAEVVLLTWTGTIFIGTLALMLPVSVKGQTLSFVDALFVSTSAVSTTGLSTISLQDDLSPFGQSIIVILMQIGGVGFMTISSALAAFSGKTFAIKEQVLLQDIMDVSEIRELREMVMDVIRYTFIIEFLGAIFLTYAFHMEGFELDQSLWLGFFHSISAFCTAGFSLFNNSLENYATNSIISWTCTILAILGGLGFIVLKELRLVFLRKLRLSSVGLNTKVILASSVILYASGTFVLYISEFNNTLTPLSLYDKFHVALFQFAATMSTSGFNSMPISSHETYTLYMMILFMFIGCSPGSTGGGIKITTFSILVQSVIATLKGKADVEFFGRPCSLSRVTSDRSHDDLPCNCLRFYLRHASTGAGPRSPASKL